MSGQTAPTVTKASCPEVEGMMLLTDAARTLGFSRQHAHRMADRGMFATLKSLGNGTVYVVDTAEVAAMQTSRREHAAEKEHADGTTQEPDDLA